MELGNMDNKSFDSKRIALGYAKRPWLHKSVIERLKTDCNLDEGFMLQRLKRQKFLMKNMIL